MLVAVVKQIREQKKPILFLCFPGLFNFVTCDHFRAPEYYTESVLSRCPMRAFPCANKNDFDRGRCLRCSGHCLSMGYDVHNPSTSIYGKQYLYSNVKRPHCGKTNKPFILVLCSIVNNTPIHYIHTKFSHHIRYQSFSYKKSEINTNIPHKKMKMVVIQTISLESLSHSYIFYNRFEFVQAMSSIIELERSISK